MFRSLRACALSTGFWSTPIPSTRRVCFPLLAPPPPPPPAALEVLLLPPQAASADAAAKPPTAVAPLNRTSRRVTPEPPSASSGGASSTTLILIRCSSPQANAHARPCTMAGDVRPPNQIAGSRPRTAHDSDVCLYAFVYLITSAGVKAASR